MPVIRRHLLSLTLACLAAGVATTALAQNVPSVNEAVAGMASGDRERAMAGRVALIARLSQVGSDPAARNAYARDVAAALGPIVAGNDPHAKLNAALVVQRLAEQGGSPALADVTAKLIADPSPAVSSYGLRAASKVLPRLLANAPAGAAAGAPLAPAVLASVRAHSESEAVATDAYGALTRVLLDRNAAEELTPAGVTAATPRAVDLVHQLMTARIAQFGTGALAEPTAEQPAINFLGKQGTWAASAKPQQATTIRLLLQLMNASLAELDAVAANAAPNAPLTRERQTALRNLVKTSGQSLSVIAQLMGKPDLQTSAQQARELGNATPVTEYRRVVGLIQADFVRAMPEARPATGPATAPAAR